MSSPALPGQSRQALLIGSSGPAPSQVSGTKVLYGQGLQVHFVHGVDIVSACPPTPSEATSTLLFVPPCEHIPFRSCLLGRQPGSETELVHYRKPRLSRAFPRWVGD